MQTELERMISFVEKLKEIDTENIQPLLHMSTNLNIFREDAIHGSISREEALKNAPQKNEAFFLVPKVIKK